MKKKRRNSTKDRDLGIRISVPSLMVFSGGLFLGYFLGGGGNVDTAVDVSNQLALANALGDNTELRGWKTLNVFYGDTYHSETSLPKQKWFSQARQDEAIASLLAEKRDGYFVDLAANDATILSNTYALERHYGWKGKLTPIFNLIRMLCIKMIESNQLTDTVDFTSRPLHRA
jgi:hypothetical protein